jgi:3-methyladenine DNA glycosylase AlkD
MSNTIEVIRKSLLDSIDSTPERVSIFFKRGIGDYAENDRFLGITIPTLRKISKLFLSTSLEDLHLLMLSPFNEERLLALIILTKQYERAEEETRAEIYQFYRKNIPYINNWNLVDSSAHLIMGAHLFAGDSSILSEMTQSQNLWERRIAIVATWYFIRKNEVERTYQIATLLLLDKHDLIHKAVGWMLREAGKKDMESLIKFLFRHARRMPKTMLRYSLERLSKEQKDYVLVNDLQKNVI